MDATESTRLATLLDATCYDPTSWQDFIQNMYKYGVPASYKSEFHYVITTLDDFMREESVSEMETLEEAHSALAKIARQMLESDEAVVKQSGNYILERLGEEV